MVGSARTFLGSQVDNAPLIFFRMCYGFLVSAETFGAILTGWVDRTLVQPIFTFSFIGFEWLQPFPGDGMIYYFLIMGTLGLFIMLGLFYRASSFLFFVMWTAVYLMQKTEYNNHYYLLVLLSGVMVLMPAHKDKSLDVQLGFIQKSTTCLNACIWFFILQILIVYVFASLNKIHMDWMLAKPIGIWFNGKSGYWLIGPLLAERWFQYVIAWGGIIYDGTIVFLLLFKPTRKFGFFLSIFFNLFNSAVFQIGIFPYLMIAFTAFFFPGSQIRKLFFRDQNEIVRTEGKLSNPLLTLFLIYFSIQIFLPIRHHLYKGDVHWSEEGHRMAWQMMLRSKSGRIDMEILEYQTGERTKVDLLKYLNRKQKRSMAGEPDMIWTFAQYLKNEYNKQGRNISVFVNSSLSLNGHPRKPLIDPNVDIANVPWDRWEHSEWILTYETYD